ncbi:acyl-CoA N-acyltransferase [Lipomyces oligophaga]|uniref:acyl-CoA N-acyltransferase n=1 Tax=Lipomyces oligophaga TaxID=45792 RepID=UPI0034CE2A29
MSDIPVQLAELEDSDVASEVEVDNEDESQLDHVILENSTNPEETQGKPKKKKKHHKKKKKVAAEEVVAGPVSSSSVSNGSPSSAKLNSFRDLLEKLALADSLSDPVDKRKSMDQYRFWKTQPVVKFDQPIDDEGPIETKTTDQIPDSPYPLLEEFEWETMDLTNPEISNEIFDLLCNNYVEDADSTFRFKYAPEFLDWAMRIPNYQPEWHVGVRVVATKKLVAYISGIPVNLRLRNNKIAGAEINFLCVHKKLRAKRLTPLMIKEVTRRINKSGIWQALYTAGVVLPKPVSTCRYYHRSLNWPKLHDIGFSPLPAGMTKAKMIARYKLPETTATLGLRLMQRDDIDQVYDLLSAYLAKFELAQEFEKGELLHWLMYTYGLDGKLNQEMDPDRIVWAYVVEDSNGLITDFMSFYRLQSTVISNDKHETLNAAYQFYYASSIALETQSRADSVNIVKLKARLMDLFNDALILAKRLDFDVFNALTLLDNPLFLEELKFGGGDGYLHYYLFNYKAFPINGGYLKDGQLDQKNRSGVAVVML